MNNKKTIVTIGYDKVNKVRVGDNLPLAFFGGPCAIESKDHAFFMAEAIAQKCEKLNMPWVYKSCYDKDCRSAPDSFHGTGIDEGLQILSDVRDEFNVPVVSDFSDAAWAKATGEVCDMVQVPAYLCRQTSIACCCWYRQACAFEERTVYESLEYEEFSQKARSSWL